MSFGGRLPSGTEVEKEGDLADMAYTGLIPFISYHSRARSTAPSSTMLSGCCNQLQLQLLLLLQLQLDR